MKKILLGILLLVGLTIYAVDISENTCIVIAMTESLYNQPNVQTNLTKVLCELYNWTEPTTNQEAYAMIGWDSSWCYAPNTNVTIYVYCQWVKNFRRDLLNTLTPAEIQRYKTWIKNQPQIEADITRMPLTSLESWGVVRKTGQNPWGSE